MTLQSLKLRRNKSIEEEEKLGRETERINDSLFFSISQNALRPIHGINGEI